MLHSGLCQLHNMLVFFKCHFMTFIRQRLIISCVKNWGDFLPLCLLYFNWSSLCGLDVAVVANDTLDTHVGLPLCSKSDRLLMRTTTAAALFPPFLSSCASHRLQTNSKHGSIPILSNHMGRSSFFVKFAKSVSVAVFTPLCIVFGILQQREHT